MNILIKRTTISFVILFITISTYSQIRQDNAGIDQITAFGKMGSATTVSNIGNANVSSVQAEIYKFPSYDNTATIKTTTARKYSISNINLNIYSNTFDSKMSGDSVYVFDNRRIESVKINDKLYKVYFDTEESRHRIFEIIFENESFSLLRVDKILYKEVRDPLNINPPKISFVNGKNYYVKNDLDIAKIVLRKKSILELLKDQKKLVTAYAKKYNLSYNKEEDLEKLFRYYYDL